LELYFSESTRELIRAGEGAVCASAQTDAAISKVPARTRIFIESPRGSIVVDEV
jgi:hypothetical protein